MAIAPYKGAGGSGKGMGVAAGAAQGFAAGGPIGALAGAAMSLMSNSAGKSAIGMGQTVAGMGGAKAPKPATPEAPKMEAPRLGAPEPMGDYNPISSRLTAMNQDPKVAVQQGLLALQDQSVPQYVRNELAEPLLRAKYFGNRGIA